MNRSERLRNWLNKASETSLTLIGIGGLIVAVLLALKLLQPLGVTATWIENLLLGLVSLLLTAISIERAKILRPIQSAISLESGVALAQKLDSLEAIASQANRLREMGIVAFYPNRTALPPFPSLIQSIESDLLICALSADVMIQAHGTPLKELLKKKIRIRFLLPDRQLITNTDAIAHLAPQRDVKRTPAHLTDAMQYLAILKEEVETENLEGKLEVRLLNFIPPMGFMILDGQRTRALIRVEQYIYKCEAEHRPAYDIVPTTQSNDLFTVLRTQFELCWNEAIEWKPSEESPNPLNQKRPEGSP
jgi:hypothetical protein